MKKVVAVKHTFSIGGVCDNCVNNKGKIKEIMQNIGRKWNFMVKQQ